MKNNIGYGIVVGVLLPAVAFGLLYFTFAQMESAGLGSTVGFATSFRMRTAALVAICLNAIPMNLFSRRRYTEAVRGIVFPTTVYVVAWLIYFGKYIL